MLGSKKSRKLADRASLRPMLCLWCIQVPGKEAEQENDEEEERKEEEGFLMSEQGPQIQDVRTLACRVAMQRRRSCHPLFGWKKNACYIGGFSGAGSAFGSLMKI